jgi:hypothetical protein
MKNGRGWYNEPVRHGLAARGIRTRGIPVQKRLQTGTPKERMILDALRIKGDFRKEIESNPKMQERLNFLAENFTIEEIQYLNQEFLKIYNDGIDSMRDELPYDFIITIRIPDDLEEDWFYRDHPFIEGFGIHVKGEKAVQEVLKNYEFWYNNPERLLELMFFVNNYGFLGWDDFHNAAVSILRDASLTRDVDGTELSNWDSSEVEFVRGALKKKGLADPFQETDRWSPIFKEVDGKLEQQQYLGGMESAWDTIDTLEEAGFYVDVDTESGFDYYVPEVFEQIDNFKKFPLIKLPGLNREGMIESLAEGGYR